jgi:hypothetical protein
MRPKRLEEVAMHAWPALQQMPFDGWIVRFAPGYTKRANSVNPLFESHLDVLDKIAWLDSTHWQGKPLGPGPTLAHQYRARPLPQLAPAHPEPSSPWQAVRK